MARRLPWGGREWRRAAVYGVGLSGRAAALLLRRHGVEVVAYDRRPEDELELGELNDAGVEVVAGGEPEGLDAGVDGVVVSPGVPGDRPLVADARRRGVPVVAEVELAFAFLRGEVVAITGSNGKSTTTALTGALLARAGFEVEVCGNIGRPLAACVEGPPGRLFVVELSSFQLETVDRFRARAAALLNVSADHLDRHRDLDGYRAAKLRIFENQGPGDVAVLNADDPLVSDAPTPGRRRRFSLLAPVEDGCWLEGGEVVEAAPGVEPRQLFTTSDLRIAGRHNLENAMAAALLARSWQVPPEVIVAGLGAFGGLPHRMERVAEVAGVTFYDDSKGTNVGATLRSLEGFADGRVHIVLGGRNKGADLRALRETVARKARRAYLVGEAAEELEAALSGAVELERSGTVERAVVAAAERAHPGEVVLLSPACASFDQFRDFRQRGERFQESVRGLREVERG